MKRIFATATALLAFAGLGASSAFAWGHDTNIASQNAGVLQGTGAYAASGNFGSGAFVSVNVSKASSGNLAAITQQLNQLNF